VRVTIVEDGEWTLSLRVPAWAAGGASARLIRDVSPEALDAAPGTLRVRRAFRAGDVVELELPVAPRITVADPHVDAVRGCVAIERGPEVMALESPDFGGDVGEAVADAASAPFERDWPYTGRIDSADSSNPIVVTLVPYHRWARRGPSAMRIWLPIATP
jgi:DUF1680 family protein